MLNGAIKLKIKNDDINYALKRLARFQQVNTNRDHEDKQDGLSLYCESVGVEPEGLVTIYQQCEEIWGEDVASFMAIGVILGLSMAESCLDKNGKN